MYNCNAWDTLKLGIYKDCIDLHRRPGLCQTWPMSNIGRCQYQIHLYNNRTKDYNYRICRSMIAFIHHI